MNELTRQLEEHYSKRFAQHGTTARGVDWNDEAELQFRYQKMMRVLSGDQEKPAGVPSVLDVGCGWGGLLAFCEKHGIRVRYTGIDVVEDMISHARKAFGQAEFLLGDVLELPESAQYDYVVCNGTLTLKGEASMVQMTRYAEAVIQKMFSLCCFGVAFNLMSNRVNFFAENLYYRSPVEILEYCLSQVTPNVVLDHGYSSLASGRGKFYDYTVYLYKGRPCVGAP